MSNPNYRLDLPVPVSGEDLPIPVTDNAPQEELTKDKKYIEWHNIASQRHIRNLAFDSVNEDLWLATGGGVLHWFPGAERFTRYASEHGLPGNSIFNIAVDGSGQVWVSGERWGLYYLKNDIWRPYTILGEVKVSYLTTDSTGKLWIGTGNGIYAINNPERKPALELPPAGFPPRAIAINHDNDIWLCNATGVHHYQNSAWIPTGKSVQPDILTLALQGNNLWLGTFRGLVRIDLLTNTSHKIDAVAGEVTALAPCTQGVWVACGGKVGLVTDGNWKPLKSKRFNTSITSLVTLTNDEVWIGTHDGLWRGSKESISRHLTDTPPDVIGSPERFCFFSNLVQALSVQQLADRSILWIGTARGLFRYDLFTENWRRNGHFGTQDIRAIINISEQDTVWVASWSKGLNDIKPQNQLQAASNISEPILVLSAGNINYWAVGLDGLYRYYNHEWMRVITNQELPVKGWLQSFSQLVLDHAWLGTSAGLLFYKPDTKEVTQITGSLGSADIRLLLAINQGNSELLWVGTNRGLYAGSLNKWEVLSELENRQITALVWDSNDSSLWVGTDRGLFRVRYRDNSWKVVNEFNIQNSGLGENRVNALAISRDEEGATKLWIGTACGLSCYSY